MNIHKITATYELFVNKNSASFKIVDMSFSMRQQMRIDHFQKKILLILAILSENCYSHLHPRL